MGRGHGEISNGFKAPRDLGFTESDGLLCMVALAEDAALRTLYLS